MSLKVRLARAGTKKRPFYRVVVAEVTAPRDGRFVEKVGTYDPRLPADHVLRVVLKAERIQHWLSVGAKPTERVAVLLGQAKLAPVPEQSKRPQKSAPRAKAAERLAEKKAKAEETIAAAEAEKQVAKEAAAAEKAAKAEAEKAAKAEAKTEAKSEEAVPRDVPKAEADKADGSDAEAKGA